MLDPIITTLSSYYQEPVCLPPLDPDPETNGKPSDHLVVIMKPISSINNRPARTKKTVTCRPLTETGLQQMQNWFQDQKWTELTQLKTAHEKINMLQKMILHKYEGVFPEKNTIISCDDQPFYSNRLRVLKRRKGKKYNKHR